MLRQQQKLKLLQKLTPQQIQVIRMLELPTVQLEQKIKKELEENPVLEEGPEEDTLDVMENQDVDNDDVSAESDEIESKDTNEEFSIEDYIQDEETPSYRLNSSNNDPDYKREDIPFAGSISFQDYLESQLTLHDLSEKEFQIAQYLIGSIEDDGYLRRDLSAVADDLAFNEYVEASIPEMTKVLTILQDLEPAGVGARNLQECLLLQLRNYNHHEAEVILAEQILKYHFEEFTYKHFDKIIHLTGAAEDKVKSAIDLIIKLNPKPGSAYNDGTNKLFEHVVPDFILDLREGQLYLTLNSRNVPELRISSTYTDMLNRRSKDLKKDKEAQQFIKQKVGSANQFIDAIRQRHMTLMLVMNAIVKFQSKYFIDGDEKKLRPMILKDIAEIIGLDVSTISRVVNSKYVQTHFGVYPLKYFFSEGMQTASGEEVSTREIKQILQDVINAEDKNNPVPDEELTTLLKEKGYTIARRTVAKYREQLGIPVARLRKEMN